VIPGIICLIFRCKRKRVLKRVNKMLEIENRSFVSKYGCEWSINGKMTALTLKKVARTNGSLGYPSQPVYPQPQGVQTPFCQQGQMEAPLFSEQAQLTTGRHQAHHGYERVSLDDSSVCYR
jgi:hypothetical protein